MFTDLATVREAVKDRLTPLFPAGWKFEASIEGAVKSLTPVLYIEFTDIEQRVQGLNLPQGTVASRFRLIVTDPKTDVSKAEDDVDEHILRLVRALDPMPDMYWDTCNKTRLEAGPLAWIMVAFALVHTPNPDTEE